MKTFLIIGRQGNALLNPESFTDFLKAMDRLDDIDNDIALDPRGSATFELIEVKGSGTYGVRRIYAGRDLED